jgi:hypothetical protein
LTARKHEQMRIGDLTVPEQARHVSISHRHIVSQELVAISRAQGRENSARSFDSDRAWQHLRVGRDAHETAFSDRAGGPSFRAVPRKPAPDGSVVHMRVPGERDESVHVEKRTTHHSSSSARRTISGVIGGVPAGTRMTGRTPSASIRAGVNPRRASSEIIQPARQKHD